MLWNDRRPLRTHADLWLRIAGQLPLCLTMRNTLVFASELLDW